MLRTVDELQTAYADVTISRAPLTMWAACDTATVLISDRLTPEQEAATIATVDRELAAAGVPRQRVSGETRGSVPRPRPPLERPAPPG